MLQVRYDWGTQRVLFLAGLDKQDLNLGKLLMNWAGGGHYGMKIKFLLKLMRKESLLAMGMDRQQSKSAVQRTRPGR